MRLYYLLGGLLPTFLVATCGNGEPSPTPRPSPTPDIAATVEAQVRATIQAMSVLTPTPIPLSPENQQEVLAFAKAHRQITTQWEQFHSDFDIWREGLVSCEVSSMQEALRGFASQAADTTTKARALPRLTPVREFSSKLIDAAEAKERTFRKLRDTWQPDSTEIFEEVDIERVAAASIQKEIQDSLLDLRDRISDTSREQVTAFSLSFDEASSQWDLFHQGYNQFRAMEADLTSVQLVSNLSQQVDSFSLVTAQIRNLPHDPLTAPTAQILLQAAEDEELALQKLRNTFEKLEETEAVPPLQPPPTGTPEKEVSFKPRDPTLFEAFGAQLVKSKGIVPKQPPVREWWHGTEDWVPSMSTRQELEHSAR